MRTPPAMPHEVEPDEAEARRIIGAAVRQGGAMLSEADAKSLLATYGIPVARSIVAAHENEAGQAAAELLRAVRRVLGGGTSFPNASRDAAPAADPFAALSRREADVARGLLRGDSLESIAERLGVGAKSASTYRRRLLDKLGLRGNADLVALATRLDYS